jgi:Subtilase family
VAPKVTLVNIRGGQDGGFLFLQPTVDAMVYAGLIGIDVINMSFFTDPWLFNCLDNPVDSPEAQLEQRTVRVATQRAIDFARAHGVTPIASLGNEHTNKSNPTTDDTSPDFPPDSAYHRDVDNSCITVPSETDGVLGISALGPSGKKADYSNWGMPETDFSAPGGSPATSSAPPSTTGSRTGTSRPIRCGCCWSAARCCRTAPRTAPLWCGTARATPAPTTATCRAPRWPHRTPLGWPRWSSPPTARATSATVG